MQQPQVDAATWVKKMEEIQIRLTTALKEKLPASSSFVQAIVEDTAMLYANSEQAGSKGSAFSHFAKYTQNTATERTLRFNQLCSILSPRVTLVCQRAAPS